MSSDDHISRLAERLRDGFAWLHARRRGASMTEFIVTLPVFLLIFQGILTLGELQRQSVGVKIEASHEMWDEAIQTQTNVFGSTARKHLDPTVAAGDAAGKVTLGHTSYADGLAATKNGLMGTHGTYGEINSLLGVPAATGAIPDTHHAVGAHLDEKFATEHTNDGKAPALSTSLGGVGSLASSLSFSDLFNGLRQSMGAGVRYGVAQGKAKRVSSLEPIGSYDFKASYDTLVAPRSKRGAEELVSVAISRLGAEQRCTFSNVLGIGFDQPLTRCF